MRQRVKRDDREREKSRQNNRSLAPDAFGETAEYHSSGERAYVVEDRDGARQLRGKAVVLLQKGRIQILRAVRKRVEAGHQQHLEKEGSGIAPQSRPQANFRN